MVARGIRNNNPLNLRRGSSWLGLVSGSPDPQFCTFVSMPYGIRAALVTLRTYHYKYHCNTIESIINRWAPSSDGNDPSRYVAMVISHWKVLSSWFASDASVVSSSLYDGIKDFSSDLSSSSIVNVWINKKTPSIRLYFLIASMAIVECGYPISYELYVESLKLL